MSSHYNTEPPASGSVRLHTTAGPLDISLFAKQTPLTCRNFLQHILDGYYDSSLFHRVVPGFVLQGGDPTGTGDGGQNIYEDREFERDPKTGDKIIFGDELHSRLKFNRRGLLGMAKMDESSYGSQFFVTLGDARAQLEGKCTMFGRVEGDSIYSITKIAEGENVEGTERPMYPFKITHAEVLEMPPGEPWDGMRKRERIAKRTIDAGQDKARKKPKTKKRGKALLSFGADEGDEGAGLIVSKPKFNTTLISATEHDKPALANGTGKPKAKHRRKSPEAASDSKSEARREEPSRKSKNQRLSSPSTQPSRSPETHRRKPSFHDPATQLPLRDPESPVLPPPPTPPTKSTTSALNSEIAALKASMRRTVTTAPESSRKKSALEQMIPETSIRGRKRPRAGETNNDTAALKMLGAFKARLEGVRAAEDGNEGQEEGEEEKQTLSRGHRREDKVQNGSTSKEKAEKAEKLEEDEDEEALLCDLHFIINCQSCSEWTSTELTSLSTTTTTKLSSSNPTSNPSDPSLLSGPSWMAHALSFERDRLGKDLAWKKKNEEGLVVIDPREREKEIGIGIRGKEKGSGHRGGR